tara:strand:+ start:19884 stop:20339 length:456 start_codon:yes stop_codon:yes gene_type:complete
MSDRLWTSDRHQDDIVKRNTGGSNLKREEMKQKPIGLETLLSGLPDTEDDLMQVVFNALRSVPMIQDFTLQTGLYENISVKKTTLSDVQSRAKKDIAEMVTREISRDQSIVGIKVDIEGFIETAVLNSGKRADKKNAENFDPAFHITYLKR